MGFEIERRYRISGGAWKALAHSPVRLRQGYLAFEPLTIRVRTDGIKGYMTFKDRPEPGCFGRAEYEYEIPLEEADSLMKKVYGVVIEKNRYQARIDGLDWVIDEFLSDNEGLVIGEVELESEEIQVETPAWAHDITGDNAFANSALACFPWTKRTVSQTRTEGIVCRPVIRPTPEEADDMLKIYCDADWWSASKETEWIAGIPEKSALFVGAFENGRMVGFGRAISDSVSDAYIQDIAVLKTHQRRGIGGMIVCKILEGLQSRGVDFIGLIAAPGAESFYEKLGFKTLEASVPMIYHSGGEDENT